MERVGAAGDGAQRQGAETDEGGRGARGDDRRARREKSELVEESAGKERRGAGVIRARARTGVGVAADLAVGGLGVAVAVGQVVVDDDHQVRRRVRRGVLEDALERLGRVAADLVLLVDPVGGGDLAHRLHRLLGGTARRRDRRVELLLVAVERGGRGVGVSLIAFDSKRGGVVGGVGVRRPLSAGAAPTTGRTPTRPPAAPPRLGPWIVCTKFADCDSQEVRHETRPRRRPGAGAHLGLT